MIYFLDDYLGLDGYSCEGSRLFPIFQTVKFAIRVVQIAVPFALIIWGSLDWFKALIAHDEKEMRIKRKPFVSRVIAAVLIIVLPWIIELISKQLAGTNEFWTCYAEAKPKINFKGMELDPDDEPSGGEFKGGGSSEGSGSTGGTEGSEGSGGSSGGKTVQIKNKCGDFVDKASCEAGRTSTYTCKWVSEQSTYNSYRSYCKTDEKIKLNCTQYGANNGKSCPKVDDYGAPCETIAPKSGQSKSGCDYRLNPKKCEDYGKEISRTDCPGTDDYNNTCTWSTKNGSVGDCITQ